MVRIRAVLFLLASLCYLAKSAIGQNGRPFPHLMEVTSVRDTAVKIFVQKGETEVFNIMLEDLPSSHPYYKDKAYWDCPDNYTFLGEVSLDNSGKKYAILWGHCPEPSFQIRDVQDYSILYGEVSALRLYVPGNGYLYASGHLEDNFNTRRKYLFKENNIQEIKQPFYYVGLKTRTLKPLTLYRDRLFSEEVGKIPSDYSIEVLLAETSLRYKDLYLIRTDFGLVGWVEIEAGQYKSVDVEGIYFKGD